MSSQNEFASIDFLKWQDIFEQEKPFMLFLDIPKDSPDQRVTNVDFVDHEVAIQDVRGQESSLDLDTNGFKVAYIDRTSISDDPDRVETHYLPVLEKMLQAEIRGADRIIFFDWRVSTPMSFPPAATPLWSLQGLTSRL